MDASLLLVITSLSSKPRMEKDEVCKLVEALDMANIVTGYFENGRKEALFALMEGLQSCLVDLDVDNLGESDCYRPKKRPRLDDKAFSSRTHFQSKQALLPNIREITRYGSMYDAPDLDLLANEVAPFIVTGGVSHWPAISDPSRQWRDPNYLLKVAGEGRIVPVEIGSSYTAEGWTQSMVEFSQFLKRIHWDGQDSLHRNGNPDTSDDNLASAPTLYLAQHDLFQQFPSLLSDITTPDFVFAEPPAPAHYPEYTPPRKGVGYIMNAWMGPKGTYSPAHTDPFFNCYAQVVGMKHIWVAPPECAAHMHGKNGKEHEEAEEEEEENPGQHEAATSAVQKLMDNTTTINVFDASELSSICTGKRNPFEKHVLPQAMQAILQEGDLLFMPPK
ncbi:MAG: hypothetical protein CYPHOPRED_000524 [Cyphobasidiales sp. Tagirdzhanova-0007]|nr:MAG: hypothetical protein CYPHOPRED_000524 [Cyphobasidiales sp. Tagirdzhanova-0007]